MNLIKQNLKNYIIVIILGGENEVSEEINDLSLLGIVFWWTQGLLL